MENVSDIFNAKAQENRTQRTNEPFDKDEFAARKKRERDEVYAMADQFTEEMKADGGIFQSYLDVQSRFDRYSATNAILIAAQMPEATRLMDFDGWKETGAYIQRGAEAITILEPGKEFTREEDGTSGVFYNPKKVFDVSQTSRRQLPAQTIKRDGRTLLKALIDNAPCRFSMSEDLPVALNAMYDPKRNTILVRPDLDGDVYYQADVVHGGRLPVHVHFVMDEFANVALPDEFDKLLSTMRSREISVSIIIQNLAQLKALFEKQWESIVGNCDEFVYLGGNEQSTHEYVSKLLGKETIDTNTYGQSKGRSGSYSTNWQITGRELMTPDEVRMLDNRYALVFIRGERPVMDFKYNILKHPNVRLTTDGGTKPYRHGEDTRSIASISLTDVDAKKAPLVKAETHNYVLLTEEDVEERITKLEEKEHEKNHQEHSQEHQAQHQPAPRPW